MNITTENFLLIGAILLFSAVAAGKFAYRFGAPALLLFLGVGLFFGYDILSFNSPELTQFIGMLALCIIHFSGGMDTKFSEIRAVLAPGLVLAVGRCGVVVPDSVVARFDNVFDRLGIRVLYFAKQKTGLARESATNVGVGERLE